MKRACFAALLLALPSTAANNQTLEDVRINLPPIIQYRVGIAQIFTTRTSDRNLLLHRDYIWADKDSPDSPTYRTRYIPFDREPDRKRTVNWYQQHDANAIVFQCDGITPAVGYRYGWGYLTPIDTSSESVREDIFDRYIKPAKQTSFDGIAFDNVSGTNVWRRCGVYREGSFVKQYTGARVDRSYTESVRSWAAWMRARSHAIGLSVTLNIYFDRTDPGAFAVLAREADIVLDEGGYSRNCKPTFLDADWHKRFQAMREVASERGLVIVDSACRTFGELTPAIVEWSLANYHLVRGDRTYLALTGQDDAGGFHDRPELHIILGKAVNQPEMVDGTWRRNYEMGVVAVNPSSAQAATVDLGRDWWQRLNGDWLTGRVTLPPATGLVVSAIKLP